MVFSDGANDFFIVVLGKPQEMPRQYGCILQAFRTLCVLCPAKILIYSNDKAFSTVSCHPTPFGTQGSHLTVLVTQQLVQRFLSYLIAD